jgi:hypothetical protein
MTAFSGFSYPGKSEKEKAEAYVRSQIPELMGLSFGCLVKLGKSEYRVLEQVRGITDTAYRYGLGYVDYRGGEMDGLYLAKDLQIIGHPIQLQHWLSALGATHEMYNEPDGTLLIHNHEIGVDVMRFNLTTGQPATEADYKAFNEIVGA